MFQAKHENTVSVMGQNTLKDYSYSFLSCKFLLKSSLTVRPTLSCHFADGWASYGERHQMGFYSYITTWIWKLYALVLQEACLTKFPSIDLISNFVIVVYGPN